MVVRIRVFRPWLLFAGMTPLLSGCGSLTDQLTDHDCMTRVMYFESDQRSEEGMLAVGTVVMNRLNNPKYPKSVCEVVGQRNQFAPGVLDRRVSDRQAAKASRVADRVLAGERQPQVGDAMFFHTAGYSYPYNNMHYVLVAGGNAFYEKVRAPFVQEPVPSVDAPAAPQPPRDSFTASYAPPLRTPPSVLAPPSGIARLPEAPPDAISQMLAETAPPDDGTGSIAAPDQPADQ